MASAVGTAYSGFTPLGRDLHYFITPVLRNWSRHGRIAMNFDTESIDGYAIPVDPMDLLQCDSCQ
jgi:hypothetical protein